MDRIFYENKAQEVMSKLKNFQRATVERIDRNFRSGSNRVLVADEVGLGKTLIARGCIAKTALLDDVWEDGLFKVVYVCSNQSIARKNIRKLNVFDVDELDNISDNRLSMQHLRIVQQEIRSKDQKIEVQLIPLTPQTSFSMTSGDGNINERALMYAVLEQMEEFANLKRQMRRSMVRWATQSDSMIEQYCKEVEQCHDRQPDYPQSVIQQIREGYSALISEFAESLQTLGDEEWAPHTLINRLRIMFANISIERLRPDLVIMDEFQRFKFLLNSDDTSEMGMIAKKFLGNEGTRVILLSATPYKLYSTLEEIEDSPNENHYKEWKQVMSFLFDDEDGSKRFQQLWGEYSEGIKRIKELGFQNVIASKQQAEEELSKVMCRTERLSVMEGADFINDESVRTDITITDKDILSYREASLLIEQILGEGHKMPMDYVKSCPYLLSFMMRYALMEQVRKYFKDNPEREKDFHRPTLWLNTNKVNAYQELPATNARLEKLKELMFKKNKSHLYMWVPPSLPYYEPGGVYRGSEGFSKLLLFSAWEMVPRMIGALVSYEAERLTIGKMAEQAKAEGTRNTNYFHQVGKRRFPGGRLYGARQWYLLYPSQTLNKLYNPIECLNQGLTLKEIKRRIRTELESRCAGFGDYVNGDRHTNDTRWYVVAPMLLDSKEHVQAWLDSLEDEPTRNEEQGIEQMISSFLEEGIDFDRLNMGRISSDLIDWLTCMAIASPVQCIYRTNGNNIARAVTLAKIFINRFNTPEGTAIVEQAYSRRRNDDYHWKDVLQYCEDGNFQAMFDEYYQMVKEEAEFSTATNKEEQICKTMADALTLRATTYEVETEATFKAYIHGEKVERPRMRAHFAVGFVNPGKSETDKGALRKEAIQNAFNSPLRPFVLASTSIGQEGLDFHNYCRRIMHWNLPGNPIDFEQREGRVNRYKCLAIRQNLAEKYKTLIFKEDIWSEIFAQAAQDICPPGESELKPFWCLGNEQEINIERLVPMYPLSRDQQRYERLIKILSLYRLTMGQARQEELLQYIFSNFDNPSDLKSLFFDLSPFSQSQKSKR